MRVSLVAALAGASLAFAAAGCTEGSNTTSPSASPSVTQSPTGSAGGPVASCVVGSWRTVDAKGSANGATIAGGGGVVVNVAATGDVTLDFTNMQPATFSAALGQSQIKGSFSYSGTTTGKVTTTSTSDTAGTWQPTGTVDWSQLKVSAELTEPVASKPLNNLPISQYVGATSASTGNVVDVAPMLGKSTYTCQGTSLTLTPDNNQGLTWTLARQG